MHDMNYGPLVQSSMPQPCASLLLRMVENTEFFGCKFLVFVASAFAVSCCFLSSSFCLSFFPVLEIGPSHSQEEKFFLFKRVIYVYKRFGGGVRREREIPSAVFFPRVPQQSGLGQTKDLWVSHMSAGYQIFGPSSTAFS